MRSSEYEPQDTSDNMRKTANTTFDTVSAPLAYSASIYAPGPNQNLLLWHVRSFLVITEFTTLFILKVR